MTEDTAMNDSRAGFDFPETPGSIRLVVAMSGGVDSSVAAALLAEAGHDVVGVTMQLYDHGEAIRRKGACCAGVDIHDARDVADRIGIPHYVLNRESRFRQAVMEEFADSYLRGETPVPCIRCNQTVKFEDLLSTARDLGAAALCTGHYVRRVVGSRGPELHRAVDPARDQSYFLYATTPEQLQFLRFPIGSMTKDQTRGHARRLGLDIAEKPDSQDICFVPQGRYSDVVRRLRPGAADPGDIVHVDGRVVGQHSGIIDFTIGQRRGLGISSDKTDSEPLYVVNLDAASRRVTVGPKSALGRDRILIDGINWLGEPLQSGEPIPVDVRLRSSQAPVNAVFRPNANGRGILDLDSPAHGVAPGQAAVMHDRDTGTRVLGGGRIIGSERVPSGARPE